MTGWEIQKPAESDARFNIYSVSYRVDTSHKVIEMHNHTNNRPGLCLHQGVTTSSGPGTYHVFR